MSEKKYSRAHIGKEFTTNEGYVCRVIEGGTNPNYCTIRIDDWVVEAQFTHVTKGQIKYPYHLSVFNVGYIGVGQYSSKTDKKIYQTWSGMLQRRYCPTLHKKHPTYKNVTVHPDWLNFQVFAKWMNKYYSKDELKYDLDKDLKSGESKVYSSETCMFIPQSLNKFMSSVGSDNVSGQVGVSWETSRSKWRASIFIDHKRKHLGYYAGRKEASLAYQKARLEQVQRWRGYYSFDYPKSVLDRLK